MRPYGKSSRFTMFELMAVMVIIILMAGIVIKFSSTSGHAAAEAETKTMIARLCLLNESYKARYGHYVPQGSGNYIVVPTQNKASDRNAKEEDFFREDYEYFKARASSLQAEGYAVTDAFGTQIYYRYPGEVNQEGYDLISYGPNGVNDNGKKDDITNFTAN